MVVFVVLWLLVKKTKLSLLSHLSFEQYYSRLDSDHHSATCFYVEASIAEHGEKVQKSHNTFVCVREHYI